MFLDVTLRILLVDVLQLIETCLYLFLIGVHLVRFRSRSLRSPEAGDSCDGLYDMAGNPPFFQ